MSKSASAERTKEVLQGLFDQYHEGTKALDFEKYWGAVKQTFPDAARAKAKENFDKHAVDGVITWTEIEKWIHSQSKSASVEKTKEVLQGLFDKYHEGTSSLDFDKHAVKGAITWTEIEKCIHSQSKSASAEKTKE